MSVRRHARGDTTGNATLRGGQAVGGFRRIAWPTAQRRRPPWLAAPGQRSQVAVALLLADTGALSADFADVLGKVRTAARKGTGWRWRGKRDGLFLAG